MVYELLGKSCYGSHARAAMQDRYDRVTLLWLILDRLNDYNSQDSRRMEIMRLSIGCQFIAELFCTIQGIPAFRDFIIRDPRYFVILFQASIL